MSSKEPEWTQNQQRYLQERLKKVHERYLTMYSYDISNLSVEVHSLETSNWRADDYRQEIKIRNTDTVFVLLELADLENLESDREFLQFLSTIDGHFMSIGTALKLNRLELAANLEDSEILALTRLITYLLMSIAELVVVEEALMNAQPPLLLETWKRAYMFYPEKLIEFNGVRYLRSDAPDSNHH